MYTTRCWTAGPARIPTRAGQVITVLLGMLGLLAVTMILAGAGTARAQDPAPKAAPEVPVRRIAGRGLLDLEDAVARAELIIAVRLVDMTEAKIVYGGKTEVVTQQFRFEPVRTLKGIFARDALLMTGQDLNISQYDEAAERWGAARCCSSCWADRPRVTSTATRPGRRSSSPSRACATRTTPSLRPCRS